MIAPSAPGGGEPYVYPRCSLAQHESGFAGGVLCQFGDPDGSLAASHGNCADISGNFELGDANLLAAGSAHSSGRLLVGAISLVGSGQLSEQA